MNAFITEVVAIGGQLVEPLPLCLWGVTVVALLSGVGARLVTLFENVGAKHSSHRI